MKREEVENAIIELKSKLDKAGIPLAWRAISLSEEAAKLLADENRFGSTVVVGCSIFGFEVARVHKGSEICIFAGFQRGDRKPAKRSFSERYDESKAYYSDALNAMDSELRGLTSKLRNEIQSLLDSIREDYASLTRNLCGDPNV